MRNWIKIVEESSNIRTIVDVADHFLSTRDDLLDDDEEIDDLDEQTALEIIRREYVSGTCAAFAVALHDKTGLPIVGMNGGMHVAVQTPNGDIIDFMGTNPLAKVLRRYGMGKDTPIQQWTREEAVEHVRMNAGDDYDYDTDPWDEINIAKWVLDHLGKW